MVEGGFARTRKRDVHPGERPGTVSRRGGRPGKAVFSLQRKENGRGESKGGITTTKEEGRIKSTK